MSALGTDKSSYCRTLILLTPCSVQPEIFSVQFARPLPTYRTVAKQFCDIKGTSSDVNLNVADLPSFAISFKHMTFYIKNNILTTVYIRHDLLISLHFCSVKPTNILYSFSFELTLIPYNFTLYHSPFLL